MLEPRFTYSIATMGCKANLTDSQALELRLQALGGFPVPEEQAELFLLNTCTVTDNADKEARQILRKIKAPLSIATGCLAQVDPEQLLAAPTGSRNFKVVRNAAKESVESLVEEWLAHTITEQREALHGDRVAWHEKILQNRQSRPEQESKPKTRAFYKVQDGCNAFCAYCVIPLARGRSRSLPADQVVNEVRALVESGVKELVLTAIHAADYEDQGLDFTGLVERVLQETSVPRLRLTSLDPAEIPDRLIELMEKEARLCPHFHVSLQSANSRVLSAMKRAYGEKEIEDRLLSIAKKLPHAYVGMDLIAGFPGETQEEFEAAFALLERLPWTRAHVFPFSVRRNTAAARLVAAGLAVPDQQIHARAARLRELSARKMSEALQAKVGTVQEILIEEKTVQLGKRVCSFGHSRNYHKVLVPGSHPANQLRRVQIVSVGEKDMLKGELI